jgi:hypothetical protein
LRVSPEEIEASYASMSEPELIELARSYDTLTGIAQLLLRAEFAKRRLDPPVVEEIPTETGSGFVTIRRFRDLSEALVARSLLESAGIPVYLRDENLVRLEWQISNFIGGIRLQVEDVDRATAIEVLDQPIPETVFYGDPLDYSQPLCPKCGSKDITFQGSSRKVALASLYLLSLPLPLGQESWHCNACDALWADDEEDASGTAAPPSP